jgi:hypothetical protein
MRRIIFVLVTMVSCAALVLLEARIDRRPVVALEQAAQSVSPSGQSARLYVGLGPEAEPHTLRARVNGEDVTSRFRFTRGGASGLVDGLRPGTNEITVTVRDGDDALHQGRLALEAPAVREHGDLTAELRATTRNLVLSERGRARASNTPARRLAELGREGTLALSRVESAGDTGRNAEGEVARVADLAGEVDAQVDEVRRYYAQARQRLNHLGFDDKLDRLDAIEQAAMTAAESMSEALALARSGDPEDLGRARRRMEGITKDPPVPLSVPSRHLVPLEIPDDPRSPFQIYLEAIGGLDLLTGGDPATLLEELVPALARNPQRPDRVEVGVPTAWAQAGDPDLDPGTGVDFDPLDPDDAIMLKAAELGSDPVAIYEFVYNEIEYELYSGLARGAKATLLRRAGNGSDQAALLIALLRASGYKARFVFGGILADVERVKSWLNVRSWEGAERLLSANGLVGAIGIPPYTDAGEQAVFLDTMMWVKALVPYGPDRGRSLDAPLRWVFLDPSFKTHEMQAGIDLPDIPFDFAHTGRGILNGVNRLTALELFAEAVRADLRASHPNQTIADMGVRGPIERVELGMLPPTLPYRPVQFHAEFADLNELPFVPFNPPGDVQPQDWMARRYIVELRDLDGTTVRLNHEIRAADFSDTRVTIGWKGATPADQTLIDNDCQGDVAMCPNPGLIDVVPIVKYDGVEQATGTDPLALASTVRVFVSNVDAIHFRNCFVSSGGDPNIYLFTNPCYYNEQAPLVVGARFLLAYDVSQNSQPLIDRRALQLVETYQAVGAAHPGEIDFPLTEDLRDNVIGELLFIASLRYGQRFDELAGLLEHTNKFQVLKQGRGQFQSLMDVYYLDGTPISIVPAGLLIDILYTSDVYAIDAVEDGVQRAKAFQLLGYTGSALEHQLWEELTQFESVSTVKGLQWVQDNPGFGATIVELDSPGDPIPPLLPTNIRTRIQQELDLGHRVLVPDRELTIELWTGVVYLSELLPTDPTESLSLMFAITTTGIAKGGLAIGLSPWIFEPPRNNAIGASDSLIRLLDPINAASGNMDHSAVDLEVATRGGLPVRLERVYNSQFQEVGPFGFGWTHSYDHYLEAIDDDADGNPGEPEDEDGAVSGVAVVDGQGGVRRFRAATGALDGTFAAEPGNRDVLVAAGGNLERLEPNGTRWRFQGFGASANVGDRRRLDWVEDRNANRTTLQYAGSELSTVTDPLGRQLSFTYSGGVITDVSD